MRFWDSSALVPLVVDEPSSRQMGDLLRQDRGIALWWGSPVECISALCRLQREGELKPSAVRRKQAALENLRAHAAEVQPLSDVRARAIRLVATHRLRGADAFQLAAALIWCSERPQKVGFVSRDVRLRAAAAAEGFQVLPYAEYVHEDDLAD